MTKLLISYDLREPETRESYARIQAAIRNLGPAENLQYSLFLVDSDVSPLAAWKYVHRYGGLDANDRLVVAEVDEARMVSTTRAGPLGGSSTYMMQPLGLGAFYSGPMMSPRNPLLDLVRDGRGLLADPEEK